MPVDPARLKDVFTQALARTDPRDRAEFLAAACAGDPELQSRIEALLRASEDPDSLLDAPGPALPLDAALPTVSIDRDPGDVAAEPLPTFGAGSVIAGRYKLLQQIGEGGMGTVWMADQTEPVKRRVAVKLIRAERGASKTILSRFEAERQAIALMSHPNIAKLLDAGTTEAGNPFFVMELVKGVPLTEYCDAHKLSVPDRLDLFRQICSAVHHAHQKGIIHRDLKPTNILVESHDGKPVPKVIDFGLAKATTGLQLTEHTLFTAFGTVAGTPLYMAPEQATFNAIDVDSRADIYALGVILYELLCGTTPLSKESLKNAALDEVLRTIREQEPPPPSSRLSQIRNAGSTPHSALSVPNSHELDWIVMKALSKERERRYDGATALAADVERFLKQEPVLAGPPSQWYRLRKAYRRNRVAVLTGGLVALVLLLGIVGTTWGMLWAVGAERQAKDDRDAAVKAQGEADDERKRANGEAEKLKAAREQQADVQYLWDMQLLPLASDKGSVADMTRLLDRHIPTAGTADRRTFEWYYWDRQLNTHAFADRLQGADDDSRVSNWAVSEDGTRLARLSPPWRENDPKRPPGTPREDSPVLTVWDTTTRRKLLSYRLPLPLPADQPNLSWRAGNSPRFSPDGRRVDVEWSYGAIGPVFPGVRWGGMAGGGPFGPGGGGKVGGGVGDPKGPTRQPKLRQVIDIASGQPILHPPPDGWVNAEEQVDFSRDGRYFASVPTRFNVGPDPAGFGPRSAGKSIEVWSLDSGKSIIGPPTTSGYANIAFGSLTDEFVTANRVDEAEQAEWQGAAVGGLPLLPRVRISVRELVSGKEKRGWLVPGGSLANLTLSTDGALVAATVPGGVVTVWELATGKQVSAWKATGGVTLLTFRPTGSRLDVRMTEVNLPTGTGVTHQVTTLNPKTGVPYPEPEGLPKPASNSVVEVKVSPDGKRLVAAAGGGLMTWDARTGKPHLTFRGHVHPVVAYGFSPDSKRVWSVERNGVYKEWDLRPVRPVEIPFLGGNERLVPEFAVSADGTRFAQPVGTYDPESEATEFAVQMRDTAGKERKLLQTKPRNVGPQDFGFMSQCGLLLSRDGRRAALTRSEDVSYRLGDLYTPGEAERKLLPAPDLTVWDTGTEELLFQTSLKESRLPPGDGMSGHVSAISPDGIVVAVGTATAGVSISVRLFDVDTKSERPPLTLAGASGLFNLTFSPNGKSLAALAFAEDKAAIRVSTKLVIWDIASGKQTTSVDLLTTRSTQFGRTGMSRARLAWFPDGSRLVLTHDTTSESMFAIHDAATGKAILPLERPVHVEGTSRAQVTALACSPDGKRVAALVKKSSGFNQSVSELKLWDTASGKEVLTVLKSSHSGCRSGPPRYESDLTFTNNGHRLLACELGEIPTWTQEGGFGSDPAFILTTWDATPVPNREPLK